MRKGILSTLFVICALGPAFYGNAQTTIVNWNFPNNPDDATADGGITANASQTISTGGGVNAASFGVSGATTNAATATGWTNGSGAKYWEISFATTGYSGITISAKQRSSSTGPQDFKLQYKVGAAGTYADVTNGSVTVATNWTSGVLSNLPLPTAVDNKAVVYLRWIMTSNTSTGSGTVGSLGTSSIDDILIQAGTAVVLPIQLLFFEGTPQSDKVRLQWTVLCERDMKSYDLERTRDGFSFTSVGSIAPQNHGCGTKVSYAYEDALPVSNAAYRLKMVEESGAFHYSPVRYFRSLTPDAIVAIAPNPVHDVLHVSGLKQGIQWRVINTVGECVISGTADDATLSLSVSDLPAGFYFLRTDEMKVIRFQKF